MPTRFISCIIFLFSCLLELHDTVSGIRPIHSPWFFSIAFQNPETYLPISQLSHLFLCTVSRIQGIIQLISSSSKQLSTFQQSAVRNLLQFLITGNLRFSALIHRHKCLFKHGCPCQGFLNFRFGIFRYYPSFS